MFSRRRSLFDIARARLAKGPRRVKRRGDGRGVKLGMEQLEDRRMLAVRALPGFDNRGARYARRSMVRLRISRAPPLRGRTQFLARSVRSAEHPSYEFGYRFTWERLTVSQGLKLFRASLAVNSDLRGANLTDLADHQSIGARSEFGCD